MPKKIELYIHGPGTAEEKLVAISGEATVLDLIEAAKGAGVADGPELILVIEDEDDPLPMDARLCDCGVKHKGHLSCHTCRKVEVTVHFNGQEAQRKFAPGRKVKGVLKWALSEFRLAGVDAENKELRLGGAEGLILQSQQHIGSFAARPGCSLELYLTGIVEVQG
jgi:hypothetical protein